MSLQVITKKKKSAKEGNYNTEITNDSLSFNTEVNIQKNVNQNVNKLKPFIYNNQCRMKANIIITRAKLLTV